MATEDNGRLGTVRLMGQLPDELDNSYNDTGDPVKQRPIPLLPPCCRESGKCAEVYLHSAQYDKYGGRYASDRHPRRLDAA